MNFPDYKFVEFNHTNYTYRKPPTIIDVSEVSQYRDKHPNVAAWISHFRFREDFQAHCHESQSVAGYDGLCYSANLWFDVDVAFEENTEESRVAAMAKALELTKKLINMIMRGYEYPADGLRCYFTGSKGFCLSMITEAFGLEPSKDFNDKCLYLVKKITALQTTDDEETSSFEIDEGVYDKTRLWRIPNTPNEKMWHDQTPRYKIPLTVNEILECADIKQIIEMARTPRKIKIDLLDPSEVEGDLAHLLDDYSKPMTPTKPTADTLAHGKHDYAAILSGELEGEGRTGNLAILIGHWWSQRTPKDEAIAMGRAWDKANDLGLDKDPNPDYNTKKILDIGGKVAYTVSDIYERNNKAGYNTVAGGEVAEGDLYSPGHNAAELINLDIPEPEWLVNDYIPQGFTILAGKPKVGKSWLALGLAVAVGCGGKFLSNIDVSDSQGDVLYLALEDNLRRLKSRLITTLQDQDAPNSIYFHTDFPRASGGGLERIAEWITNSDNPKLIVIDTLQKFRNIGKAGGNIYAEDYTAVEGLKRLADQHNISVVVLHHQRKMGATDDLDTVSGSLGLTGAGDMTLILTKERMRADGVLKFFGRDIEETELALRFDNDICNWILLGKADDYRATKEQQAIIDALRESEEAMSPKEVAELLGKTANNMRVSMRRMANNGIIKLLERGKYRCD